MLTLVVAEQSSDLVLLQYTDKGMKRLLKEDYGQRKEERSSRKDTPVLADSQKKTL